MENGKLQGLEWLIEGIEGSIANAFVDLESYLKDTSEKSRLEACKLHMHQVYGALQMAECRGGMLLADETIQLIEAVLDGQLTNRNDAHEVLVQAAIKLPVYIKQIVQTGIDEPETLIGLLNDLRTVSGKELFSESPLFVPNISCLNESLLEKSAVLPDNDSFVVLIKKLRQMYQMALLGVIRESGRDTNLVYIEKVFSRLKASSHNTPQYTLWQTSQALQEGLRSNTIELTITVRSLLKSLDRELRRLEQGGSEALQSAVSVPMLKNLLYYIATSNSNTKRIAEVKTLFHLDESLPIGNYQGSGLIPVYDSDAVGAMSKALLDVLVSAKELLSEYHNGGLVDFSLIENLNDVMIHMSDTFSFVGGEGQLKALQELLGKLAEFVKASDDLEHDQITDLAERLMDVEASILSWGNDCSVEVINANYFEAELDNANEAVRAEAINSLSQVKEAISKYISSEWDQQFIASVPHKIDEVCGVLAMLEMGRTLSILQTISSFIDGQILTSSEVPQWCVLEQLADAITSVEHFLDGSYKRENSEVEAILSLAEASVQELIAYSDGSGEPLVAGLGDLENDGLELVAEASIKVSTEESVEEAIEETEETEEITTPSDSDVDEEIREIFVEEATEVLGGLHDFLPACSSRKISDENLEDIRRAFHTLKGSGRMVSADATANLAWAVENMLNGVVEKISGLSDGMIDIVAESIEVLPSLIKSFENNENYIDSERIARIITAAENAANIESSQIESIGLNTEPDTVEDDLSVFEAIEMSDLSFENLDEQLDQGTLSEEIDDDEELSEDDNIELREIFAREAGTLLAQIDEFVAQCREDEPYYSVPSNSLLRALHTLRGSATMADIDSVSILAEPLEALAIDFVDFKLPVEKDLIEAIDAISAAIKFVLPTLISENYGQITESDQLLTRLHNIRQQYIVPLHSVKEQVSTNTPVISATQALTRLIGVGLNLTMALPEVLDVWADDPESRPDFDGLAEEMKEFSQTAADADSDQLSKFTQILGEVFNEINKRQQGEPQVQENKTLITAQEILLNQIDAHMTNQEPSILDADIVNLEVFLASVQTVSAEGLECSAGEDLDLEVDLESSVESTVIPKVDHSVKVFTDEDDSEDLDMEIIEIFMEEANELLETVDTAIHRWQENPASEEPPEELQRALHTFKGGARMAGLMALGEQSHDFETVVVAAQKNNKIDEDLFTLLGRHQDQLLGLIEALHKSSPDDVKSLIGANEGEASDGRIELTGSGALIGEELDQAAEQYVPQEVVKVPADKLDELVNMAGESSISRARIEQQVSDFGFTLDEMSTTIARLEEQVRRLGSETDAQVTFRREQVEAAGNDNFDPLEMDRYSTLQQLSRALLESTSDIHDLKNTLLLRTKDANNLLTQQGRINTELQKSLMRSRMVPFARMVPRLRRIVRQVSGELGKKINLQLINIEGEMDRSILERMVPSLEHMLRNAVDHGIESAEQRKAAGKPEIGVVSISLLREGGDILIRLADDGAGLDIDTIRNKAIKLNMLPDDPSLSEMQIIQCVLRSGFSTSGDVSQISGRGVGLDVVNSDVREVGGSISIKTDRGVGTELQIRLPFTVSINRALMIESGDDIYALPMSSIAGVIRMRPDELASYYRNPDKLYKYGDRQYPVRYLGSLLNEGVPPRISAAEESIPLVLVHTEQQSFAVQVDRLGGSSEIVVKTLTRPFSTVPGLSGATVLGDGRVVVILDLLALLRAQRSKPLTKVQWLEDASAATTEAAVPTIIVVDDSVTVRKVTSRFLAREGFNILTAKDGVDAMRILRDHDPDVMLLDIEMPRMDGFEVAGRLRSMSRFENLPIIMITSRTGSKHREQAKALGVNNYLGKPYSEELLLSSIKELLEKHKQKADKAEVMI